MFNTVYLTIFCSKLLNWWNSRSMKVDDKSKEISRCRQWEKDYSLQASDRLMLFDEYLEMGMFIN